MSYRTTIGGPTGTPCGAPSQKKARRILIEYDDGSVRQLMAINAETWWEENRHIRKTVGFIQSKVIHWDKYPNLTTCLRVTANLFKLPTNSESQEENKEMVLTRWQVKGNIKEAEKYYKINFAADGRAWVGTEFKPEDHHQGIFTFHEWKFLP
jgi:hypothetical protein